MIIMLGILMKMLVTGARRVNWYFDARDCVNVTGAKKQPKE